MELPELPNAVDGQVITRFPPEASGFLHLGHIKALMLNHSYARKYHGKIILRFDDTNPDKENKVYEEAIEADIETLHLTCDQITFTSDYFDQMLSYAQQLIVNGLAYVDDTTANEMQQLRSGFKPSVYQDTTPEENQIKFEKMIDGTDTTSCLRAKIDFASKNGCLRDPVIYRSKAQPHPRTGTTYKIYPTYDFACPIVDSIEKITHTMRSVEYKDRDAQYNWFLTRLYLQHGDSNQYPIIKEYGKMSFKFTVLSKRKLAKLVDAKLVDGWDDPRMPTVRGIIKRGMHVEPLKNYIQMQGFSVNPVNLSSDKMWSMNSDVLSEKAVRLYGLDSPKLILAELTGDIPTEVILQNHPKIPERG